MENEVRAGGLQIHKVNKVVSRQCTRRYQYGYGNRTG